MIDKCEFNVNTLKQLISEIDNNIEALCEYGENIPCIEKNGKQIKALVNLLKIEFSDI